MFSMKFTKTKEPSKVVKDSKLRDPSTGEGDEDEKDFIIEVDKKQIHGTKKKEEKKELVIPLIAKNEWRDKDKDDNQGEKRERMKELVPLSLEQQAIQELMGQGIRSNDEDSEESTVPLLLQNQVPQGFEEDEGNLDVSLRPSQSSLEDYEQVPIEEFGMAMLRGMGWSKTEGIGLKNKQHVEMLEPQLRPKGLGLGASISSQANKAIQNSHGGTKEQEELVFKIGAGAVLLRGPEKGMYGRIEAFDEDNNRVVVKLAINGKMATVSKFYIDLVAEKDYKTKSKVLNYDQYSEYKEKQDKKEKERRIKEEDEYEQRRHDKEKSDKKQKDKDQRDSRKEQSSKSSDKHTHSSSSSSSKSRDKHGWVRPHLKVRFVDKKYKHGKYYEKKFVVDDVIEEDRFVLRSESGNTLIEDISSSQLETVIPKEPRTPVCIVSGKRRGNVGELVERNRSAQTAIIKIPDGAVYELSYDDICEFVGDPEDFY